MKIHFCDLCNESVPQSDLDGGRARVVKGRIVCGSCERAMSLGRESEAALLASSPFGAALPAGALPSVPEPPATQDSTAAVVPSAAARSWSPVWIASASLLATALAVYVFEQRFEALQESDRVLARELEQQQSDLRGFEGRLAQIGTNEKSMEQRLAARFQDSLAQGEAQRTELAAAEQRAEQSLTELKHLLAELRKDLEGGALVREQRLDELSHRVALGEDVQRQLGARLNDVQKSGEDARSAADAAAKAQAAAPPPAKSEPAWKSVLPNLADASPSTRWEAVDELGRSKDPAAIPHVTPLLKDSDLFVRMCAARVLADLGTLQGVPALIDALEDGEPTVRESAWNALRTLTGKDFKFDPQGNEADRTKKIKLWREWWKKDGEPLLNGGGDGKNGTQKS